MYYIFYMLPYSYEIGNISKTNQSSKSYVEEVYTELLPLYSSSEPTESVIVPLKPKININYTNICDCNCLCNCDLERKYNTNLIITSITTSVCGIFLLLFLIFYKFYYKKRYKKNTQITEINNFGIEMNSDY